jgi:iron complex outermembrane receptor protein
MMSNSHKILVPTLTLSLTASAALCQVKSVYENMSLDEILNIDVVVTASKKPEDLFDAPLSVTIIKKEEITRSGATSIPEVLRLSPGLIVREITPGNYDVQIRGYDDITKNVYVMLPFNTTTLVMIDNRIVYSYYSGGTFWETFPIDINDVERIEVVRGPASALYGPNAVTGVINIITSHADKSGMNVFANGTAGTNQAKNASANIGYNWNDKTKISFSGNFTERHRFMEEYYDYNKKDYTSLDDLTMFVSPVKDQTTDEVWKFKDFLEELGDGYNGDLSLRKMGGNIFFTHHFSEQSNIEVALGAQNSQSQKTGFLNFSTPLSQTESKSYYLNTRIKQNNFTGQFNLNSGHDDNNYQYNSYKFTNIEANLEYFKQFKEFSLRPGISYKYLAYNSPTTYKEPFNINELNYHFKDEPRVASSYSAYLLSEWKPTPKLRFIGAIRIDKFDINKNYFKNYEIASTYRLNKNNLVRLVYSRANKSPFFFDSFLNSNLLVNAIYISDDKKTSFPIPVNLKIRGQEDLKYPTITNQEISWRTKINSKMSLDIELFYSRVKNFVNANIYREYQVVQHMNTKGLSDSLISIKVDGMALFENYDLTAQQYGAGFTFNYDFNDKFSAKIYGTYQKTKISGRKDIDFITTSIQMGEITPENTIATQISTVMNPTQWSDELTPSLFGGFLLNYKPCNNWNFSTDAYAYSGQKFANYNYYQLSDEASIPKAKVEMYVKSNIILNAKASYRFNKNITSYATLKNILGNQYEYGFADQIGTLFLVGLSLEL